MSEVDRREWPVVVIGMPRVWDEDLLAEVTAADLVVCSPRLEAQLPVAPEEVMHIGGNLSAVLDRVTATESVVVLASGDPGWFGIVRALESRVGVGGLRIHPGVSSVARAFAEVGTSWEDALVVSAHGRDPRPALMACRRFPKVAVLTSPDCGPDQVQAAVADLGRHVVVGIDLGGDVDVVMPWHVDTDWPEPNVVLVMDPLARSAGRRDRTGPTTAGARGLPEDAFSHRDGQITKAEVRAVALGWLAPGIGRAVWDVGAGSGSVAVEASLAGAAVWAIERDHTQRARIDANATAHEAPLTIVAGSAPRALDGLPDPDAAFVGGGGPDVVAAVARRTREVVVVALATLERIGPSIAALQAAGFVVEGTQVAASRLAVLPDGSHRLAAQNPVTLLRGIRPSDGEGAR